MLHISVSDSVENAEVVNRHISFFKCELLDRVEALNGRFKVLNSNVNAPGGLSVSLLVQLLIHNHPLDQGHCQDLCLLIPPAYVWQ